MCDRQPFRMKENPPTSWIDQRSTVQQEMDKSRRAQNGPLCLKRTISEWFKRGNETLKWYLEMNRNTRQGTELKLCWKNRNKDEQERCKDYKLADQNGYQSEIAYIRLHIFPKHAKANTLQESWQKEECCYQLVFLYDICAKRKQIVKKYAKKNISFAVND